MPEKTNDKTIFSLLEVSQSIQRTLSERYKSSFWIKAEMNKLNYYSHSGHCYPELVEKKDGKVIAQLKGNLWNTEFIKINHKFLKVPAAIYVGNGFGKLSGVTQVEELGTIESPIILTNTLSVSTAMNAVIDYTLKQKGNENVRSVNAVVGETNDGGLNDIRGRHVTGVDVLNAIRKAEAKVEEGNVGAGTGTICFGFKGGIDFHYVEEWLLLQFVLNLLLSMLYVRRVHQEHL